MYGLDGGERQLPEQTLDHLAGYRASRPVRVGNQAYTQYQADVVGGEIMIALDQLRRAGLENGGEGEFAWALQLNLLDLTERRLDVPDRGGIWEVRGDPQKFTHGRVMMWAAFDRGIRAVEEHGLTGPVERWRGLREQLRTEILTHGVRAGAFVQHYATDEVDAALLQIPQTGFVAADSDLMRATVTRIEQDLLDPHGFVRRYRPTGGRRAQRRGGGVRDVLVLVGRAVRPVRPAYRRGRADGETAGHPQRCRAAGRGVRRRIRAAVGQLSAGVQHLALVRAAEALG